MNTLLVISCIIAIAGGVSAAIQTGHAHALDMLNKQTKSKVYSLANTIRKEIDAKRLSANRILALLQTNNQNALLGYVVQNPLVQRSLDDIKKDSARLAQLQADLSSIETEIANLTSQVSQLGYASTHGGVTAEKKQLQAAERELKEKRDRYSALEKEIQDFKPSDSSTPIQTGDLDAKSQNIQGGLK